MVIVWGSRMMGKCDTIPGIGHVATRFGHVYYLPLIPRASFLVIANDGKNFRGVPIYLSFRSIMMAWARTILVVVGLICTIMTFVFCIDPKAKESPILIGVVAAICWIALGFLCYAKMFTQASFARACELAKELKLTQAGYEALAKAYGQAVPRGFEVQPVVAPRAVQQVASSARVPSSVKAPPIPLDDPIPLEPEPARGRREDAGEIGLV